jgi:hypothetical protein
MQEQLVFFGNHVINHLTKHCPAIQVFTTARSNEKVETFNWYPKVVFKACDISSILPETEYFNFLKNQTR